MFFLSTSRSSVAEISWGPYGQVNMLVLCKHRLPNIVWGLRISWVVVVVVFLNLLIISARPSQTELLPHCSDVPPLAQVVQQDGKLLVQALLEVGSDTLIFLFFIISSPTHLPESLAPPFFTFLLVFSTQGIGGAASRNLMEHYAEVLFSLNKNCFTLLVVWLKEALQPPGFPSSRITDEQKANFSSQILR